MERWGGSGVKGKNGSECDQNTLYEILQELVKTILIVYSHPVKHDLKYLHTRGKGKLS